LIYADGSRAAQVGATAWPRNMDAGSRPAGFSLDGANAGSGSTASQHPGFYLRIIVLALPRHFLLMRFEIIDALLDFVAL
jgi:hypothetical protein